MTKQDRINQLRGYIICGLKPPIGLMEMFKEDFGHIYEPDFEAKFIYSLIAGKIYG